MKAFKRLLLFGFALTILLGACRKSDRDNDTETQSAVDNAVSEKVFGDLFAQVAIYAPYFLELADDTLVFDTNQTCPSISILPALPDVSFPKILTINYGTGCTGADGVIRKGSIITTFSNKWKTKGATVEYNLDGYQYGGMSVSGTHSVTNSGYDTDSNLVFLVNVSNGSINTGSGIIYWASQRQRTWVSGEETASGNDDAYTISGSSSGTGTKGTSFSTEITTDLSVSNDCAYIKSGVLYATPGINSPRTIDFGTACSNAVTVTINGEAYSLTY